MAFRPFAHSPTRTSSAFCLLAFFVPRFAVWRVMLCCVFCCCLNIFGGKQNIENKPSKGEGQRGGWKYYYALHMCLAWHVSALPAFLNTSCQVTLLQAFFSPPFSIPFSCSILILLTA